MLNLWNRFGTSLKTVRIIYGDMSFWNHNNLLYSCLLFTGQTGATQTSEPESLLDYYYRLVRSFRHSDPPSSFHSPVWKSYNFSRTKQSSGSDETCVDIYCSQETLCLLEACWIIWYCHVYYQMSSETGWGDTFSTHSVPTAAYFDWESNWTLLWYTLLLVS